MVKLAQQKRIARTFGSASKSYDVSARLQRNSGKNLLPWLPLEQSNTVLDLGCGTGFFTDILASHYSHVIGVDISRAMLAFCRQKCHHDVELVLANAMKLPLANDSVNIVFSNLVLQWCDPLSIALKEALRVLKPGGTFVFSTLLDGTLTELKQAWAFVDDDKHVNDFLSIDALESTLADVDITGAAEIRIQDIVLEYENVLHLAHELKGLGASHVPNKQNKGLAGRDKWNRMCEAYERFKENSSIYPATYKLCSVKLTK